MNPAVKTMTLAAVGGILAGLGCGSATPTATDPAASAAASAEPAKAEGKNGCAAAPGEKHGCSAAMQKEKEAEKPANVDKKPDAATPPK